jgi:hypothetical protein
MLRGVTFYYFFAHLLIYCAPMMEFKHFLQKGSVRKQCIKTIALLIDARVTLSVQVTTGIKLYPRQ